MTRPIQFEGLTFIRTGWAGTKFNVYKNNTFCAAVEVNPWEKIIHNIEVVPSFRLQGIATTIYKFIEKDFKIKLKPSNAQTNDAKEFWKRRLKENKNMISFKQFLLETKSERSNKEATKLVDYLLHRRYERYGKKPENWDYQLPNIGQKQEKFFSWINKSEWGIKGLRPSYDDFRDAIKHNNLQPTDVPVDQIVSNQDDISANVVKQKIKGKWKDHDPDYPYVYKYHNVYVLIDGNHRLSVARLKRQKYLKAYVLDTKDNNDNV